MHLHRTKDLQHLVDGLKGEIPCVLVYCLHVYLCHTGVIESCELPRGGWQLNPGPLEEQSVLFTAESALQRPEGGFHTQHSHDTEYDIFLILG